VVPFKSHPAFDGSGWDEPHHLAMLFEVAGDRVTVTPDLIALRWDALDGVWRKYPSNSCARSAGRSAAGNSVRCAKGRVFAEIQGRKVRA